MSARHLLTLFLDALAIAAVLTPVARRIALRWGATDAPGIRRINVELTPRLGGIVLLPAILVGVWLTEGAGAYGPIPWRFASSLVAGGVVVMLLGVYDDFFACRALPKLLVVVGAGVVAWLGGFQLLTLPVPFVGTVELGILAFPLTLLWIVAMTNAMNLLDGLDGLATGVAAIAAVSLAYMTRLGGGSPLLAATALALAGACAGFLLHNRHPARIFLGDSGSLLIGFVLGCLSLRVAQVGAGSISLALPAIALGVPLIDMVVCFFRRLVMGHSPFQGDCGHIHHLLLATGLTQPQVAMRLYAVTAVFGGCAVWLSYSRGTGTPYMLLAIAVAAAVFYGRFGYLSWSLLRHGRRWSALVARAVPESGEVEDANRDAAANLAAVARSLGLDYVRVDVRGSNDDARRTMLETGDKRCRRREYPLNVGDARLIVTLGNGETHHRLYTRHLSLTPLLERIGEAALRPPTTTRQRSSVTRAPDLGASILPGV